MGENIGKDFLPTNNKYNRNKYVNNNIEKKNYLILNLLTVKIKDKFKSQ